MKYSIGDIVEFKIGSFETQKGQVKFIEEDYNQSNLYIDSYSGWAYKVPEKKIVG
jgi:transcription antitermination factor NusG